MCPDTKQYLARSNWTIWRLSWTTLTLNMNQFSREGVQPTVKLINMNTSEEFLKCRLSHFSLGYAGRWLLHDMKDELAPLWGCWITCFKYFRAIYLSSQTKNFKNTFIPDKNVVFWQRNVFYVIGVDLKNMYCISWS